MLAKTKGMESFKVEISQFAPVLIPTLNRYEHFKRCVESLSKCTHAVKTDLYIALDYPAKKEHWDGYEKIKVYLESIKGFKRIEIIKRDKNFGAFNNMIHSMNYVFSKHDRIIYSEDDNEFSPNFLDYINKGLDKFEEDPNVVAICGYLYPVKMRKQIEYNYIYAKAFSAWGFGIWRKKSLHLNSFTSDELIEILRNKELRKRIRHYDERKLYLIQDYVNNNVNAYGDRSVVIDILISNKYCIFPTISKVRNHGHDGTGAHCGRDERDIYSNQKIDTDEYFNYSMKESIYSKKRDKEIRKFFKIRSKHKIKKMILLYTEKHKFLRKILYLIKLGMKL